MNDAAVVRRKLIALDFDGVIHNYTGWKGPAVIDGGPVPGAVEWIKENSSRFEFVVTSSRTSTPEGREAMIAKLSEWDLLIHVTTAEQKPPAWMTLDDRGFLFQGQFPAPEEIEAFKPWWLG